MLETGTSGLMSGDGKQPVTNRSRSSALPRLYAPSSQNKSRGLCLNEAMETRSCQCVVALIESVMERGRHEKDRGIRNGSLSCRSYQSGIWLSSAKLQPVLRNRIAVNMLNESVKK